VCRLFTASVAKLLGFHPFRVLLLVFGGGVIAIFAIAALQSNNVAHKLSLPPAVQRYCKTVIR
jgi:hypothetical protein